VRWLEGVDTGISSETIWRTLTGETPSDTDVPCDPSDFGRCYRLLKIMPEWRPRLREVARKYRDWRPFVRHWDELTALYEAEDPTGTYPKLYERMQKLRGTK
jgi:hypothetical protein